MTTIEAIKHVNALEVARKSMHDHARALLNFGQYKNATKEGRWLVTEIANLDAIENEIAQLRDCIPQ